MSSLLSIPVSTLEQARGQSATRLGNPRVGGSDHGEELNQASPDAFTLVSRQAADQLDQPTEAVVDVAAADIEVGNEELGVDVVGAFGGRGPSRGEVGAAGAGHEANTSQSLGDLVVARMVGLEPLLLGDGGGEVAFAEGLVSGRESWVRGILRITFGWCRPGVIGGLGTAGHAVLHSRGDQLVEVLADLIFAQRALEQRDRLPAEYAHGERNGLRTEGLRDRRVRVDVDPAKDQSSVIPIDDAAEDIVECLALRGPRRPEVKHHDVAHRRLQHVGLEVLVGDVEGPSTATRRRSVGRRSGQSGQVDRTRS